MAPEQPSQHVRNHWIDACDFHPVEDEAVLELVRERVRRERAQAKEGVVLLDLDSTLYQVAPRTLHILREGTDALGERLPSSIADALRSLDEHRIGYSLRDTFRLAGLPVESEDVRRAEEILKAFWKERFFTSEYLRHDRPYPGTPEFVDRLHQEGATIVYLTGRDRPGMHAGTVANLRRDGFVFDVPRTHLWMKEHPAIDDLEHKVGAARAIATMGTLVASLENEPRNLAGLYEAFPDALHVFVETICSESPAPVCRGIYRVRRFVFTT